MAIFHCYVSSPEGIRWHFDICDTSLKSSSLPRYRSRICHWPREVLEESQEVRDEVAWPSLRNIESWNSLVCAHWFGHIWAILDLYHNISIESQHVMTFEYEQLKFRFLDKKLCKDRDMPWHHTIEPDEARTLPQSHHRRPSGPVLNIFSTFFNLISLITPPLNYR